jgi:hypothetical protein
MKGWIIAGGLALVATACSSSAVSPPTASTVASPPGDAVPSTSTTAPARSGAIPDVDLSLHSVPLDEIHFDTFDGGSVPLSEAGGELILALRDAIPPIDEPAYGGPETGSWLGDGDLILGYVAGEQAYAYPIKILDLHEIVNDELDGVPILISYCPLCRSGVVFDRRVEGRELDFGNTSALFESDLVMLDRQTGSYWWQVPGEAIVGTLTGTRLDPLPSTMATWPEWLAVHPETLVLAPPDGNIERYLADRFGSYEGFLDEGNFGFPVGEGSRDPRLPASELVVGVELEGIHRVYPIESLGDATVNDSIGGIPVVLFSTSGPAGALFSPVVGDRTLTFQILGDEFRDDQTGSTWNLGGLAVAGDLDGTQLTPIPTRTTFWFAYVGAFPQAEVWQG